MPALPCTIAEPFDTMIEEPESAVPLLVPPCPTVTVALVVRIVALALGKVNVLALERGPLTVKNALAVPPLAEGSIPVTSAVKPTAAHVAAPEALSALTNWLVHVEPTYAETALAPLPNSNPVTVLIDLLVSASEPANVANVPVVGTVSAEDKPEDDSVTACAGAPFWTVAANAPFNWPAVSN